MTVNLLGNQQYQHVSCSILISSPWRTGRERNRRLSNEDPNYTVSQKTCCRIFAITSSNVNRFWKSFHCFKQQ